MSIEITLVVGMLILLAGLSYRFGEAPERLIIGIILGKFIMVRVISGLASEPLLSTVRSDLIVLDLLGLAAMVLIAVKANRVWTMVAAGAQVLIVYGHASAYLSDSGMQRAYWALTQPPVGLQLLALISGLIGCKKRRQRAVYYCAWLPRSSRG
ncbi:hypothetical protein HME9302_01495 [Alteripontixanthobacter maritimus]|uniref:Uncharacterized protein n=1 Tax=Alteripontixanthobacter maritimus TaxID=2161824 RepID=A0A369Q6F7_9SPHN|nr:hypothetical protein HME9302_01495 [Alteripontixanthobacter maritimus]